MTPLAYRRVLELADAHCRILKNSHLQMGQDEDLEAAIDVLQNHGHFQHTFSPRRVLHLNGGLDPIQIQMSKPGEESDWNLVVPPGQAKILFREWLDGVFTPESGFTIFTSERQMLDLLEGELERLGYQMGDPDG